MKKTVSAVLIICMLISCFVFDFNTYAEDIQTDTTVTEGSEETEETEEEDYEEEEEEDEDTMGPEDVVVNDVSSDSKSVINESGELRAVWISVFDFQSMGLFNKSEAVYRETIRGILERLSEYKCNAIIFHARAHDDATWKSQYFTASRYLVSGSKANMKSAKAYTYDPMGVFIEEAHAMNMEFHAWMNPYRIEANRYYDPSKKSSRDRVLKAVDEVLQYDVDGIHFDDYFYHSTNGYVTVSDKKTSKKLNVTPALKRKYVNALVSAVYTKTHEKGKVFGIAPQGNYENDMNSGADVKTWLSKKGYVDYVMPQIYWTDQYGSKGDVKMFTNRLNLFRKLNTCKSVKLCVGLALYNADKSLSSDIGWKKKKNNMVYQIKKIRKAGLKGYSLFTLSSFYTTMAKKELKKLKKYLNKTTE
ncbi:MAG: family 10 glycosylhydrolase [Lachnospiraceae bacterium]|nr:family 10 glycosylhydrolase [Lachnospiraceae bacterium]